VRSLAHSLFKKERMNNRSFCRSLQKIHRAIPLCVTLLKKANEQSLFLLLFSKEQKKSDRSFALSKRSKMSDRSFSKFKMNKCLTLQSRVWQSLIRSIAHPSFSKERLCDRSLNRSLKKANERSLFLSLFAKDRKSDGSFCHSFKKSK